jgi:hypothetical protein
MGLILQALSVGIAPDAQPGRIVSNGYTIRV